jgi:hypothetical protein
MTTVQQIVDGAAEELGVKTAEINLEPADFQAILNRLNDLGTEWADKGITPSFVEVFNSTDTVSIDRNAVAAFKYMLAGRSAPAFQRAVSPTLASLIRSTVADLEASVVFIGEVAYPDTLPKGSGNDHYNFRRFYGQNKEENF